jgi:hypothetical protein
MTSGPDVAAFAHALQSVLAEVRAEQPDNDVLAEERIIQGLADYGVTLTTEVVGALAYYAVHGP